MTLRVKSTRRGLEFTPHPGTPVKPKLPHQLTLGAKCRNRPLHWLSNSYALGYKPLRTSPESFVVSAQQDGGLVPVTLVTEEV
jgi:hypothetical protein